jgi:hypothetical protein
MRDKNFEEMTNKVIEETYSSKIIKSALDKKIEKLFSEYYDDMKKFEEEIKNLYKNQ